MTQPIVYTVVEVAEILHTNRDYVMKLIHAGQLPALKLGCLKVRKEALESFLASAEGYDYTDPSNPVQMKLSNENK